MLLKFSLVLVLSSFVLASSDLPIKNQDVSPQQLQKQNRQIVQLASKEISKQLPQKVDKYTTMTKVIGKDTSLLYIFEINSGAKSDEAIIKEDHSRMQKAVTNGICRTSKRFLEAQIDITYRYISAVTKRKLFDFFVDQDVCLKLKRR
jgi:hypothetical protein